MRMPKADKETEALFRSLLPNDPRISVRPMFGHAAAFVNGNLFAGTFGAHIFVRLRDDDEALLLMKEKGRLDFRSKGRQADEGLLCTS
jgi:TfoX/Sxy family transcriptional regulator of competence genes